MSGTYTSLSNIQTDLQAGVVTLPQLVASYLHTIELKNPELNAFVEVYADEAKAQAQIIQGKIAAGTAGPLAGAVIGIKDNLAHQGRVMQASSKMLTGFKSQFTATAIQRLIDADAIIIGRQNCDEFAMGSSNESSVYGAAKNAADPARVPGGSSGASAAAVQANMCLASIGSDTGGSVRQPGAFCGVVGLKPSYSRISRWGLIAFASSFDCIGPIAHNVADAAALLQVMAGQDEYDSTVSTKPVDDYLAALQLPVESKKIAVLRQSLDEAIAPEIREAVERAMTAATEAGHTVEIVDFELLDFVLPTYYIITMAEASSNLGRYDGARYGYRSPDATDLYSMYTKSRSQGFGPEVKRRIMLGTFVLSASYYDAYFTKAQRVRRLVQDATNKLLAHFDAILTPTTPAVAYKIGEKSADPLAMYLGDIFTVQANVTGHPAISFPAGKNRENMPIGLQLLGRSFQEAALLQLSQQLMGVVNLQPIA